MIPVILGLPLHFWLGILLLLSIVFQIVIARKLIHVPFKVHRIMGYVILLLAIVHGFIAIGLHFGFLSII